MDLLKKLQKLSEARSNMAYNTLTLEEISKDDTISFIVDDWKKLWSLPRKFGIIEPRESFGTESESDGRIINDIIDKVENQHKLSEPGTFAIAGLYQGNKIYLQKSGGVYLLAVDDAESTFWRDLFGIGTYVRGDRAKRAQKDFGLDTED